MLYETASSAQIGAQQAIVIDDLRDSGQYMSDRCLVLP